MSGQQLTYFWAWVAMVPLGCWCAWQKNRALFEGFILGTLFGPFGVLVELLLPTRPAAADGLGLPGDGKSGK